MRHFAITVLIGAVATFAACNDDGGAPPPSFGTDAETANCQQARENIREGDASIEDEALAGACNDADSNGWSLESFRLERNEKDAQNGEITIYAHHAMCDEGCPRDLKGTSLIFVDSSGKWALNRSWSGWQEDLGSVIATATVRFSGKTAVLDGTGFDLPYQLKPPDDRLLVYVRAELEPGREAVFLTSAAAPGRFSWAGISAEGERLVSGDIVPNVAQYAGEKVTVRAYRISAGPWFSDAAFANNSKTDWRPLP